MINVKKVIRMIQEFNITPDILKEAQRKADEMGALKNSMYEGKRNVVGFVGELAVSKILNCKIANTYNYDLILPNGETVDVKTQSVAGKPLDYYECNVNDHSMKQKCDYYAFARVDKELSKGWYLGKIRKKDFLDRSVFYKKGSVSSSKNFTFKRSCYTIQIKHIEMGDTNVKESEERL